VNVHDFLRVAGNFFTMLPPRQLTYTAPFRVDTEPVNRDNPCPKQLITSNELTGE